MQVALNYKLKFNHSPQLWATLLHSFHTDNECLCVFRGFTRELGRCSVDTNLCLLYRIQIGRVHFWVEDEEVIGKTDEI